MIKNILFDYGGIILNIDPSITQQRLIDKGVDLMKIGEAMLKVNAYNLLETGHMSPDDFRAVIKENVNIPVTDQEIDEDWNALLLDMPVHRIELLKKLKTNYTLYLLSNTNKIHYDHYAANLMREYNCTFEDLFTKPYFSHELGFRKPNHDIYKAVIADSGMIPEETLFIDDSAINTKAARELGFHTYTLIPGDEDVTDLFENNLLKPSVLKTKTG